MVVSRTVARNNVSAASPRSFSGVASAAKCGMQIRFELPNVNHVFQPGHRIMVQIQSTLFPLYDRNPQTFVPNIFNARPADYRKADVTVLRSKNQATAIVLPVVE